MTEVASNPALSRVIRRDDVPEDGLEIVIDASPEACAALAETCGIPSIDSVSAILTVTRWRKDGLAVRGTVRADVIQTCVVSLDPVAGRVEEDIACFFLPGYGGSGASGDPSAPPSQDLEAAGEDADIDDLVDGRLDLGALVAEHVALGLDPYPRKAGSVFKPTGDAADAGGEGRGEDTGRSSPFAALSALKSGPDSGRSDP